MKNFKKVTCLAIALTISTISLLNASSGPKKTLTAQEQRVLDAQISTIKIVAKKADQLTSQNKAISPALVKEYEVAQQTIGTLQKKYPNSDIKEKVKESIIPIEYTVKKLDTELAKAKTTSSKTTTAPKTSTAPQTDTPQSTTRQPDITAQQPTDIPANTGPNVAEQRAAESAAADLKAAQKRATEQAIEKTRQAASIQEEAARIKAEKEAANAKIAAERLADKTVAEKKANTERLAAERKAISDKEAADKQAALEKKAAEKQAQKEATEKAAADRAAADRAAEQTRKEAADKAAADRAAADRAAADRAAQEKAAADRATAQAIKEAEEKIAEKNLREATTKSGEALTAYNDALAAEQNGNTFVTTADALSKEATKDWQINNEYATAISKFKNAEENYGKAISNFSKAIAKYTSIRNTFAITSKTISTDAQNEQKAKEAITRVESLKSATQAQLTEVTNDKIKAQQEETVTKKNKAASTVYDEASATEQKANTLVTTTDTLSKEATRDWKASEAYDAAISKFKAAEGKYAEAIAQFNEALTKYTMARDTFTEIAKTGSVQNAKDAIARVESLKASTQTKLTDATNSREKARAEDDEKRNAEMLGGGGE